MPLAPPIRHCTYALSFFATDAAMLPAIPYAYQVAAFRRPSPRRQFSSFRRFAFTPSFFHFAFARFSADLLAPIFRADAFSFLSP